MTISCGGGTLAGLSDSLGLGLGWAGASRTPGHGSLTARPPSILKGHAVAEAVSSSAAEPGLNLRVHQNPGPLSGTRRSASASEPLAMPGPAVLARDLDTTVRRGRAGHWHSVTGGLLTPRADTVPGGPPGRAAARDKDHTTERVPPAPIVRAGPRVWPGAGCSDGSQW